MSVRVVHVDNQKFTVLCTKSTGMSTERVAKQYSTRKTCTHAYSCNPAGGELRDSSFANAFSLFRAVMSAAFGREAPASRDFVCVALVAVVVHAWTLTGSLAPEDVALLRELDVGAGDASAGGVVDWIAAVAPPRVSPAARAMLWALWFSPQAPLWWLHIVGLLLNVAVVVSTAWAARALLRSRGAAAAAALACALLPCAAGTLSRVSGAAAAADSVLVAAVVALYVAAVHKGDARVPRWSTVCAAGCAAAACALCAAGPAAALAIAVYESRVARVGAGADAAAAARARLLAWGAAGALPAAAAARGLAALAPSPLLALRAAGAALLSPWVCERSVRVFVVAGAGAAVALALALAAVGECIAVSGPRDPRGGARCPWRDAALVGGTLLFAGGAWGPGDALVVPGVGAALLVGALVRAAAAPPAASAAAAVEVPLATAPRGRRTPRWPRHVFGARVCGGGVGGGSAVAAPAYCLRRCRPRRAACGRCDGTGGPRELLLLRPRSSMRWWEGLNLTGPCALTAQRLGNVACGTRRGRLRRRRRLVRPRFGALRRGRGRGLRSRARGRARP